MLPVGLNRARRKPVFRRIAPAHAAWHRLALSRSQEQCPASRRPSARATTRSSSAAPNCSARLEGLGERARHNPGYARARTLLNTTFRKAKLVQRAAILEAADWLIAVIDRTTMML